MAVDLQENCQVVTDIAGNVTETGIPLSFTIPCPGSYVAYESLFTRTRVTGTLFVVVNDSTCSFTVTAERSEGDPIIVTVSPTSTNRVVSLTVDCLQSITFTCSSEGEVDLGACVGLFTLQLHWCKCC